MAEWQVLSDVAYPKPAFVNQKPASINSMGRRSSDKHAVMAKRKWYRNV